jgi:adenine-specific DNA-methyltransferase
MQDSRTHIPTTEFAQGLRRNMTEAERRFWSIVRCRRINGLKFRRQQPIGPFVVDFVCVDAKLIVELDGAHHRDEEQFWHDYKRTAFLNGLGFEVMRFANVDVLKYPLQVAEQIAERVGRAG